MTLNKKPGEMLVGVVLHMSYQDTVSAALLGGTTESGYRYSVINEPTSVFDGLPLLVVVLMEEHWRPCRRCG